MFLRPVVIGALVVLASPAAPQDVLTEADFIAPFVGDHPSVTATNDRLARAEAALARARSLANPRLSVEREQPGESRQTTFGLNWVPPLDGRRGLAMASARAGVASAETDRALRLAHLRLGARGAFAEWAMAWERRRALSAQSRLVAGLAERAATRAQAGEESGLVARRIGLTFATLAGELAASEAALARAEANARALRPDLPVDVVPDRAAIAAPGAAAPGLGLLDVLQKDVEQARLEERLAGRFWGAPEIQAGWQRLEAGGAEASGPVLGASWSLPLFDRNQGGRAEAARRRSAAEARLLLAAAGYTARVAGADAAYVTLARAARDAEASIQGVPALVEAATASFTAGESTATDLLDVLRSALDAQTRAIEAHAAALAAARMLEAARMGLDLGELR